jgi:hypothetical protein
MVRARPFLMLAGAERPTRISASTTTFSPAEGPGSFRKQVPCRRSDKKGAPRCLSAKTKKSKREKKPDPRVGLATNPLAGQYCHKYGSPLVPMR